MTHMMPRILSLLLITAFVCPLPAQAKVPLNQEVHINEQLVAAAIGEIIRQNCSRISPRYLTFYRKAKDLEDYARAKGYTEAEVKAFLKDKTEQARVKRLAEGYLAERGVVEQEEASYCKAGRAEIKNGTLTGELLRAW